MNILEKLRVGKREHIITLIPGSDIEVALVALTNKEIVEANEEAIKFIDESAISKGNEELILIIHVLAKCMRDKTDLNIKIGDFDDIYENLDPYIVFELNARYLEVQSRAVTSLEDLSKEEFDEIKKKLEVTPLKDLDGELRKSLKYFHLMMHLKALQVNN